MAVHGQISTRVLLFYDYKPDFVKCDVLEGATAMYTCVSRR
jgi:hypothetical protein